MAAPMTSHRSGRNLSKTMAQPNYGDEAVGTQAAIPADPQQAPYSQTPCQMSQAPPISAIAARTNSRMDRMIVMGVWKHNAVVGQRGYDRVRWSHQDGDIRPQLC